MKVLKKLASVLLVMVLILPIFIMPLEMYAKQNQTNEISYIIKYMDKKISKGQNIPSNAKLSVCFEYESTPDILSESIQTIALPEHLVAANNKSIEIMAEKPNGEKSKVGVLKKSKKTYIPVWDEVNDGVDKTTIDTEKTIDTATGGSIDVINSGEDNWKISFTIPTEFDKEYLSTLEDNSLALKSGGKSVTINVFESEITDGLAPSTNKFEEAVTINHNTGTTSKPTGLYRSDGEIMVNSDDIVYKYETLLLRYNFNFNEEQFDAIYAGVSSKSYVIPVPDGLIALEGNFFHEINTTIIDEDGNLVGVYKLGEFKSENNQLTFTFCGSYWDNLVDDELPHELNEIYIEFNCRLCKSTISDQETYVIDIIGVGECTIYVGDNIPTPHTLVKEGNDYKNDRFKWRLTYTPGSIKVSTPVKIIDMFDTDQILIEDSFRINGVSVSSDLFTITEDDSGTTIVYEVTDSNIGEAINIEYETTLSDDKIITVGDVTVNNDAYLVDYERQKLDNSDAHATAKATKESKSFIVKSGETSADGRSIKWTVEIRTLDRRLDDLVMFDVIPKGLELIERSIMVNGNDQSSINWVLDNNPSVRPGYETPTVALESKTIAIDIKRPSGGVHESLYTVTYETAVSEEYYEDGKGDVNFSNNAWLYFTWMHYDGVGYNPPYRVPEIEKIVTIYTNFLKKEGIYDKRTGQITWTVTVNPKGVYIKEGTITDLFDNTVTANEHKYVEKSFISDDSRISYSDAKNDNQVITVTVGEIGTETVEFSFRTQVKQEHSHYNMVNPNGEDYINQARFEGTVLSGGKSSGTPKSATSSVKAIVNIDSKVLAKKSIGYDYSTKHITWEITVNHNLMNMKGITLVDTIGTAQSYVKGSLKIDGVTAEPMHSSPNQVMISIRDLENKKAVVTYETLVDVTSTAIGYDFYKDPSIIMKNEVSLYRDGYAETDAETGEQELNNKILQKTGELDSEEGYIAYVVNINPYGIDVSNKKLIDELPEGLRLDPDSVKLYEADVLPDGKFQKKGNPIDSKLSYNPALGNVKVDRFNITFPSATTSSYVLLFDCYIINYTKMPFKNKVEFDNNDIKGDENSSEHSVGVAGGSGGAFATSSKKAAIVINKVDSDDPDIKLKDVEFELYRSGNKIMDGKTDSEGKLTFYPLSRNQEYVLKEVITGEDNPDYDKSTASLLNSDGTVIPFDSNNEYTFILDKTGEILITVTNDPIKEGIEPVKLAQFKFTKYGNKDGVNTPLAGASFALIDNTNALEAVIATAVSGRDGTVIFSNIPNGTYILKETVVPVGYIPMTPMEVIIDKSGKLTKFGDAIDLTELKIVNDVFYTDFVVTKEDAGGAKMIDVVFELYQVDNGVETFVKRDKTDQNGILRFEKLQGGNAYLLKEIAPSGFYQPDNYRFSIDSNIQYSKTFVNYPIEGSISILKLDAQRKNIPLSDVEFGLYYSTDLKTPIMTGKTGVDGMLKFEKIPLKYKQDASTTIELFDTDYIILELKAKPGYIKNSNGIAVKLTESNQVKSIIVENEPKRVVVDKDEDDPIPPPDNTEAESNTEKETDTEVEIDDKLEELEGETEEVLEETEEEPEDESTIIIDNEIPKVSMDNEEKNANSGDSINNPSNQDSENNDSQVTNPRTGDNSVSNIVLISLMFISLAAAVIVLYFMRKERRQK